jgi:hypothetical protein
METSALQQQLFVTVKNKIASHLSAAEEIAKVLDISADSAYRRIRGEKTISLDELFKLCSHYRISLDQMLNIQTGAILFNGQSIRNDAFKFEEYLTGMLHNMAFMNSFKKKELYYLCKDIPIFHHFNSKALAAFKYYIWMKAILNRPEFNNRKFSFADYPEEIFVLGRKNLAIYNQFASVEFWNIEAVNSTIRQIEFYRDIDMYDSDNDVFMIYEDLEKLLNHLEKQASLGYKFDIDDTEKKPQGAFQMYLNELLLFDNSIFAVVDEMKIAYLSHSAFNYMLTRDLGFCDHMYEYVQNLMRKSTLISSDSEKERARFFKQLRDKIARRKESLSV